MRKHLVDILCRLAEACYDLAERLESPWYYEDEEDEYGFIINEACDCELCNPRYSIVDEDGEELAELYPDRYECGCCTCCGCTCDEPYVSSEDDDMEVEYSNECCKPEVTH